MESGYIGIVESDNELEDYYREFDRQDGIPGLCLEVREQLVLSDGRTAQTGRAAKIETEQVEEVTIDDGEIVARERRKQSTDYTTFLYVPGSFMAVESSSGKFAFDIAENVVNSMVHQSEFDLDTFVAHREEADPWKVGFKQDSGLTENGVVHGEDLLRDPEIGGVLANAEKNQIGLEYNWQSYLVKSYLTQSGYIEVYQPDSFDTSDFVEYVEQEVMPYAKAAV